MKNPWKNIGLAFSVMYDEEVVIELEDGTRLPVEAMVCTDNTAEPLSEEMVDSSREDIAILLKEDCWEVVLAKVKRGNLLERPCVPKNGKKYSVSSVILDSAMGLVVRARSMK